jgi:hypothetical protein
MLIKKYGYLTKSRECIPGDIFRLTIDNVIVCEQELIVNKLISMWSAVEIDGHIGYIVGDDTLLESLLERGFRHDRK